MTSGHVRITVIEGTLLGIDNNDFRKATMRVIAGTIFKILTKIISDHSRIIAIIGSSI